MPTQDEVNDAINSMVPNIVGGVDLPDLQNVLNMMNAVAFGDVSSVKEQAEKEEAAKAAAKAEAEKKLADKKAATEKAAAEHKAATDKPTDKPADKPKY
jgi:hypothetical protein